VIAAAPLSVLAALLIISGAEKWVRPLTAAAALHRAGVPAPRAAARLVAAGEIGVGLLAALAGGRVGGLALGLVYAGFLAFLATQRAAGNLGVPCGCFGASDAPLGAAHVAVDAAAVAVAAVAVAVDPPGLVSLAADHAVAAALTAVLAAVGALQLRLLLTDLAALRHRAGTGTRAATP
jgi:hypothetical protein